MTPRRRSSSKACRGCCPALPVVSEESTGNRPVEGLGRPLLHRRSARRHPRIPRRSRRVHRQHRAGRERHADRRRGRGSGPRPDLARLCVGHGAERLALAPGRGAGAARERVAIRTRAASRRAARASWSAARISMRPPMPMSIACRSRERIACGSALKFCLIAEGSADLYPRLGADVGMGRRGGPRRAGGGRRRRAQARRQRCAMRGYRRRANSSIPASSPTGDR